MRKYNQTIVGRGIVNRKQAKPIFYIFNKQTCVAHVGDSKKWSGAEQGKCGKFWNALRRNCTGKRGKLWANQIET